MTFSLAFSQGMCKPVQRATPDRRGRHRTYEADKIEEAEDAIAKDRAEAILLGCAGLGPIDKVMQSTLRVPVFDGTACAVKLLEGLHHYGATTGKMRAYLTPEQKEIAACPTSLAPIYAGGAISLAGDVTV